MGARRKPKRVGAGKSDPMLRLERLLWDIGYRRVAGVDEVGIGPLAGPVVAAAVVFSDGCSPLAVADSKTLSHKRRETLDVEIRRDAVDVSLGIVECEDLEELGMYDGGREAMRRAVAGLGEAPDYLLVDAREVPDVTIGQSAYTGADGFVYSVAAASIVAKEYRDNLMRKFDGEYPGYGFGDHMGYGTRQHFEALRRLGPCPIHRRFFEPVKRSLAGTL